MADAPFVEVYSGDFSAEAQRTFTNAFEHNVVPLFDEPLVFSVGRLGNQLRVDFGRAIRGGRTQTTTAGNYVVAGPSAITVTSVVFTPADTFLLLNVTGAFGPGTYTLTLASQTAQALNDGQYNITTGVDFEAAFGSGGGSAFNTGFN